MSTRIHMGDGSHFDVDSEPEEVFARLSLPLVGHAQPFLRFQKPDGLPVYVNRNHVSHIGEAPDKTENHWGPEHPSYDEMGQ